MPHYDSDRHKRRSARWSGYDYTAAGAYFVTISIQGRLPLLGSIAGGTLQSNPAGEMVARQWGLLPQRFPFVALDAHIVMPDHLHGIVVLGGLGGPGVHAPFATGAGMDPPAAVEDARAKGTLPGSLGRVIQAFKALTTRYYGVGVLQDGWIPYEGHLWQRNYHDRVIRNERELMAIREYIRLNPVNWANERGAREHQT